MKKEQKVKLTIFILVVLLFDIFMIPWLLKFPFYMRTYGVGAAARQWLNATPFPAILDLFKEPKFRNIWLIIQPMILVFIFNFWWAARPIRKKNKSPQGLGGPDSAGSGQHGTSRWATEEEIERATTVWHTNRPINKGGFVVGMEPGDLSCKVFLSTEDTHVLGVGITRRGKSRRIILPTIWVLGQAGESMIVADPKGELHAMSKLYLASKGYNIIYLDFRNPKKGNRWNIMNPIVVALENGDISKASEAAWDAAHTIVHQNPQTGEPIWYEGAESCIAALMLYIAIEGPDRSMKNMTSVYYTLAALGETDEEGNSPILHIFKNLPINHPARLAFTTAAVSPHRTRGSFFATVASLLRLWADPGIADLTSRQDHNLEDIGTKKTAVFLVIPDEKTTRNMFASLYIDQSYQVLVDLANQNKRRLPIRVNYVLDEFGNLPVIKDFSTKLTVAGGRNIRYLLMVQDFGQLESKYRDTHKTIKGNCHTWLYLYSKDEGTRREFSEQLGKYTVETESHSSSINSSRNGHSVSSSSGLTGRPLMMTDELLHVEPHELIFLNVNCYPAMLTIPDLSEWPANADLVEEGEYPDSPVNQVPIWVPEYKKPEDEAIEEEKQKPQKKKGTQKKTQKGGGQDTEGLNESKESALDQVF